MTVGSFQVFDKTLEAMLLGTLGSLDGAVLSGVLLGASYSPDVTLHATYADIVALEISGGDYAQSAVSSAAVTDLLDGVGFSTADVSFGSAVTISGAKYLALVVGSAGLLQNTDRILGVQDLNTDSPVATVASTNGEFTVQTPVGGWFVLARS
ncbi:hypothetical protein GCM10017044_10860 [Kordiimonas sediminis]|uniref:Uncharacterized protein n=1 Tax=Kordiimonas sediminis TaxID=1735581 RepID=A0A919E685_9PROT|nr:hypothetical protein [Kordiimonas sediminis]GHF18176.1 hypothetical protein GCM10017044_10860 [Kordiimonas sediminis]